MYEVVIGSVHPDELTCTLDEILTCTSSDRGDVFISQFSHLHQALNIMSISHITLMLNQLMNLKIILELLPFNP